MSKTAGYASISIVVAISRLGYGQSVEPPIKPAGVLRLTQADMERVAGSFERDGIEVTFDALHRDDTQFMVLRTLAGNELIRTEVRGADFITAILGGRLTMVSHLTDDAGPSIVGDADAYLDLMRTPEYRILPDLSEALGDRGVTGRDFPPSLRIHYAGLGAARTLGILMMPPATSEGVSEADSCQDVRSDPFGNQCLGMCGNTCNCWRWVCGDCCIHAGCLHHDFHCGACSLTRPIDCLHCALFHIPGGCESPPPVTVTPSSATFDCSGPGIPLSARGGVPPYRWTTSAGQLVGGGANVTLVAPPNPGAGLGIAYSIWDGSPGTFECSGGHLTCSLGWACIGPGGPLRWYYCSGAFAGGADCGGAFDCVGYGPECPVDCQAYEAPTIASCGPRGVAYDRRSPEQIAGGCNPCPLVMGGGALVTVTDSHGEAATATIRF